MLRIRTLGIGITIVAVIAALGLGTAWSGSAAQDATPVATPIAVASPIPGGVPCTDLFGIAAGNACVLVFHGSHDAGPFDVYVDGTLAMAGATFGLLGDFVPVAAGERLVQLVPSGAGLDSALAEARVRLREGIAYEVAALGPVNAVRLQILPVDTRPLPEGMTRLRVVHGSPDTPAVDLAITGGAPIIRDVRSGQTSETIELPSGTYGLDVRVAGEADVLLPLPGTNLFPNTTYTFYLSGSTADGSLGVTLVPVFITPEIAAAATPVG